MEHIDNESTRALIKKRKIDALSDPVEGKTRQYVHRIDTMSIREDDGPLPYKGGVTAVVSIPASLPADRRVKPGDYHNRVGVFDGNEDLLFMRNGDLVMVGCNPAMSGVSTSELLGFSSLNGARVSSNVKTTQQLREVIKVIGASKTVYDYRGSKGSQVQYSVKVSGMMTIINTGPFALEAFRPIAAKIYYVPPTDNGVMDYMQKLNSRSTTKMIEGRMVPVIEPINPHDIVGYKGLRHILRSGASVPFPSLATMDSGKSHKNVTAYPLERDQMEAVAWARIILFISARFFRLTAQRQLGQGGNVRPFDATEASNLPINEEKQFTDALGKMFDIDMNTMTPKSESFKKILLWMIPDVQSPAERQADNMTPAETRLSNGFSLLHQTNMTSLFEVFDTHLGCTLSSATPGDQLDAKLK